MASIRKQAKMRLHLARKVGLAGGNVRQKGEFIHV